MNSEEEEVIEEEEMGQIDQENNMFGFNMMIEESNPSIEVTHQTVNLKKHGMKIGKTGLKAFDSPAVKNMPVFQINADHIEQIRRIGRGAAGTVWLANYFINGVGHEVAIKQIPIDSKQSRDQFVNDLKVFLTSDNPYVVKFYGCFYREGMLSQVIEYMNLGSIRDIIRFNIEEKRPLLEQILAEISLCILNGLVYIHKEKHQIHRDIKPENILINSKGEVKITDFGISKQLERTHGLSKTYCGTFIYMSPERVLGNDYSSNCDVWSFGLMLYELATSRPNPYSKASQQESDYFIVQKIYNDPVPSFLHEDNRSDSFASFLQQCLIKDPKQRPDAKDLCSHPWIINNVGKVNLAQFMKFIGPKLKKKSD